MVLVRSRYAGGSDAVKIQAVQRVQALLGILRRTLRTGRWRGSILADALAMAICAGIVAPAMAQTIPPDLFFWCLDYRDVWTSRVITEAMAIPAIHRSIPATIWAIRLTVTDSADGGRPDGRTTIMAGVIGVVGIMGWAMGGHPDGFGGFRNGGFKIVHNGFGRHFGGGHFGGGGLGGSHRGGFHGGSHGRR